MGRITRSRPPTSVYVSDKVEMATRHILAQQACKYSDALGRYLRRHLRFPISANQQ
jgi:hypothetical protein